MDEANRKPYGRIVAEYDYFDEHGQFSYQVLRYDPKKFCQRSKDDKGNWVWSVKGISPLLFKLPELLKAKERNLPIFICEGEKDVLAMMRQGLTATCNSGGAGKWPSKCSHYLSGASVGIIADKDKAGREHAEAVAASLAGVGAMVRVFELPDLNQKEVKDAADFFAAGGRLEELIEVFDQTIPYQRSSPQLPVGLEPKPAPAPIRLCPESCILHPTSCISTSLHNNPMLVVENLKSEKEAKKAFASKHPALARFYEGNIETRFPPASAGRNKFLTESIPFLFRAVGQDQVLYIAQHWYEANRHMFKDDLNQHMSEAKFHLKSVANTYLAELGEIERQVYELLETENEKGVFRICRDLAFFNKNPDFPPPLFFISFDQLSARLGIFPQQAQRFMRSFEKRRLLIQVEKGTMRSAGQAGKAGTYQWLLNVEEYSKSVAAAAKPASDGGGAMTIRQRVAIVPTPHPPPRRSA